MSHRHGWPYEDPRRHKCVELGPGHCIRPTVHGGSPDHRTADGGLAGGPFLHVAGYIVAHEADDLEVRCEGGLTTCAVHPHDGSAVWDSKGSLEGGDLTLSPSVLCARDQDHGFVRDGAWVPA